VAGTLAPAPTVCRLSSLNNAVSAADTVPEPDPTAPHSGVRYVGAVTPRFAAWSWMPDHTRAEASTVSPAVHMMLSPSRRSSTTAFGGASISAVSSRWARNHSPSTEVTDRRPWMLR
jgi:hypothetical protein